MSNESKEGKGRNWTNTLLFLILMAIIAVGLGVWEARQAAKSHPVKEEKAKDDMPNAAADPCPCLKQNPGGNKKGGGKKKGGHRTEAKSPQPAVTPVAATPPVVPVVEKTTKKELLADVDPDFNRTKFVPDEEPQKVVVVNRTVDISTPERHHSHYPWSYWGTTYSGPYGADTQRIVGGQTYSPATPVITPPPGHSGGNGNGSVVTPPPGHSGM